MKSVILITGVTGAIGYAAALELVKAGKNDLILIGRNIRKLEEVSKKLTAINFKISIKPVEIDLSDKRSVSQGINKIRANTKQLTGILNIAATFKNDRILTKDGIESMFATNHLGPFQLTTGLFDILIKVPNSRVVNVTAPSITEINFDNLQENKRFSPFHAFGASKMANILFTYKLAREFKKKSNAAICFHPGLVKSNMMKEIPQFLIQFSSLLLPSLRNRPKRFLS